MTEEVLVHESRIAVPYAWAAGAVLSRFLKALRDERKILANRCPSCRLVFVPPRKTCGTCFADCAEWLEVGPRGTLVTFTDRPWCGLIRLEGAGTALLHRLAEGTYSPGVTVEAVFAENRTGSILDIAHFQAA